MQNQKKWQQVFESSLEELIVFQKNKLLKIAEEKIPHITSDDILQIYDFPELEQDPVVRYEEGVLEGLLTVKTSFLRSLQESFC